MDPPKVWIWIVCHRYRRHRRDNSRTAVMPWYVDGELVDDAQVRNEAQMMRPRYQESVTDMDPIEAEMQLREWALENVIERILLRQTALADPEPVPPEVIEQGLEAARTEAGGLVGCGTRNSEPEIRQQ